MRGTLLLFSVGVLTLVNSGPAAANGSVVAASDAEIVWRDGTPREIFGKYTIRNDGATDIDLEGQALSLRFPGYVKINGDDAVESVTRARASDWTIGCLWSYVEGRYNGTNVCPSIEFVVNPAGVLEVRFIHSVKLCPGCVLRGDSSYRNFQIKHKRYLQIAVDNEFQMLETIGVGPYFDLPEPEPTHKTVCFPRELDFSFSIAPFPSRFEDDEPHAEIAPHPLGTPGYDSFLRLKIDMRNRQSIDYDLSDVVIKIPFDWTIVPSPEVRMRETPDSFVTKCHGGDTSLCVLSRIDSTSEGYEIRFLPGSSLCPGCSLAGRGPEDTAYEIYNVFLFPLDVDSTGGASAYCEAVDAL